MQNQIQAISMVRRLSFVAQGRLFEQRCADLIRGLGVECEVTQQGGDGGVDIAGLWTLPSGTMLEVVAQCKSSRKAVAVSQLREFEAASTHYDLLVRHHRQACPRVGLFLSEAIYTTPAIQFALASPAPLILATVATDAENTPSHITALRLNRGARDLLPGLTVGGRYGKGVRTAHEGLTLLWFGKRIQPLKAL